MLMLTEISVNIVIATVKTFNWTNITIYKK